MNAYIGALIAASGDTKVEVDRVVKAARILARLAGDDAMYAWTGWELNGYDNLDDMPGYRKADARVKVTDRLGRSIPLVLQHPETRELLSMRPLFHALSAIQGAANEQAGTEYKFDLPQSTMRDILADEAEAIEVYHVVPRSAFQNVLNGARTHVFEWAIDNLGKAFQVPPGIGLGSLLDLPAQAPAPAPMISDAAGGFNLSNAKNVQIVLNPAHSPTTLNSSSNSLDHEKLRELAAAMQELLRRFPPSGHDAEAVSAAVHELTDLAEAPRPRAAWVSDSLRTLRTVFEGAAGNLAAEFSKPHLQALIASVSRSVSG